MLDALKAAANGTIDRLEGELLAVSHAIHARPELAFGEHFASALLADTATRNGLRATRGVFGLETAFDAACGPPGAPTVAILAEYDALPGIGHACGHNLIATAALGASLALHALGDALPGRIRFVGTPAEEKGGGKELMARRGAFDGVDAAMMIHPSGMNLATMPCLCVGEVTVTYHGRAAHASAVPHKGVNALDALLLAYQAISNLRQHIRATERIHGIVTHGGDAPNIVPALARGDFYVRAATAAHLAALKPRVQACFEAGAQATGCSVDIAWRDVDYLDLETCWPLARRFQRNAEQLGREFVPMERLGTSGAGSTDMGNVSHRVPSIHPMLAAAPRHVVIHNAEFATYARGESGDRAALDGARALAMSALDFLCDADLRGECRRAFEVARGLGA
jgi:amidohydrolase